MENTFNFILIKDPHFQFGFRNNIRKHGWERAVDDKIDQIINYATEHQIKNIFFTGDVFEKSKKKDWSLNQLQQNKKRLKRFKEAGLEVYSNAGNHDYFDGHETIEGTAFGEMVEAGLIRYIGTGMHPVEFPEAGDLNIRLYGIDHHQSIEKVEDELIRVDSHLSQESVFKILLMHSNITDKNIRLTDFNYSQISKFNIDIVGCGHWHLVPECGPVAELNNTWFLNPWNLTRVARDYSVKLDEHRPQLIHGSVVLVADKPQVEFKEICLNVPLFSEAFQIEAINLLQQLGKKGFNFFKEIELDQEEDMNEDAKLIESIAKAHEIPTESIEIAKDLLIE